MVLAQDQDPVELVLSLVQRAKRIGHGRYMAMCPAHRDDQNSLQITRGNSGNVLLKCFAGCSFDDVVRALGITPRDTFAPNQSRSDVLAVYNYETEGGVLLYQVLRRFPKRFVQRRPDPQDRTRWIYDLEGVQPTLYRLPDLVSNRERAVVVVEGEKDADRLWSEGVCATTNSAGAGKWKAEHTRWLVGRPMVVVIPDNDNTGGRHAEQVADSLCTANSTLNVRVVALPDVGEHGDVSDWLDAGHTIDELREIIRDTESWEVGNRLASPPPERHRWDGVPITDLTEPPEQLRWLWRGYIAPGMITLLTGLWKVGKSTLLTYMLKAMGTRVQQGTGEFAGQEVTPCKVLVVSEEAARHWITRRDEHALSVGLHVICRPFNSNPDQSTWGSFLEHLSLAVKREGYGLVIFDSLPNLWAVRNENDAAEVKAAVMGLNAITEQGASVLLVGHHAKDDRGEFKATRGSGSLMGIVDVIMEYRRLVPDDMQDTNRVLVATGRFDETPHEVVLRYMAGFGFDTMGTRVQQARTQRKEVIDGIVPEHGTHAGYTVQEIHALWPQDGNHMRKPPRGVIASDLSYLVRDGIEYLQSGGGTSADPFRYTRSPANRRWERHDEEEEEESERTR